MNPDDYAWIHESHLGEAACVTVVPRADRDAVLAAFGAREVLDPATMEFDAFEMDCVQVVELAGALVVIEDNGFQGSRPEVLGPVSAAAEAGVAASFFWNVEALTQLSGARHGSQEFAVELLGPFEEDDEELEGIPAPLLPLVIEVSDEDGDPVSAGLALLAHYSGVSFGPELLQGGTWYVLEPTPDTARTHAPDDGYDPLSDVLPGASRTIATLSPTVQRALAQWAVRAAVRESDLGDHPVVSQVLRTLGPVVTPLPASLAGELDQLARSTAAEQAHFDRLESILDVGGRELPDHPFYEATVNHWYGDSRAISHLEGAYLGQRRWTVEALREVGQEDAYSAAVTCVMRLSSVVRAGRTERGWTFREDDAGRWREGTLPNPRLEMFRRAVAALIAELASADPADPGPEVWLRADAALPRPLTAEERQRAIRADAEAAARGEFSTYQVVRDPDEPEDVRELGDQLPALERDLRRLDAQLAAVRRPEEVFSLIAQADDFPHAVARVRAALGADVDQAYAVIGIRYRRLTPEEVQDLEWQRSALLLLVEELRGGQ